MKNFALIKQGLPVITATPASDADYQDGQVFDDGEWREFPLTLGHHDLLQNWYYKGEWRHRPESPGRYYQWNNESETWELNLAAARQGKSEAIRKACEVDILAGFLSSALGSAHHYPSDLEDQANLTASVMRSTLSDSDPDELYPFKCMDAVGIWDFRAHTAAQIQQVGKDGYAAILAYRQQHALLQAAIQAATTESDLEAIAWDQ